MLIFLCVFISSTSPVFAGGSEKGKPFNAGEMIMHHIQDSHDWHLWDYKDENEVIYPVSIPLPVILYHQGQGLQVFMSSNFHHGHSSFKGYALDHGKVKYVNENLNSDSHSGHFSFNEEESAKIWDFSITKNVLTVFIVAFLVVLVFSSVARGYSKRPNSAPKGIQSLFEPIIVFIRDDIARPIIGEKKYMKFLPFLLSVFFFIWFGNMLGLIPFIPGGANMTGNIAVTLVMAIITFIITTLNGNGHYWRHILAMPGVPWPLYIILTPIELLGMVLKPLVLAIRLFANITAGHITILAFLSLIFILKQNMGDAAGWGASVASVALSIFMTFLEILVAFLQAFIFTLLSATYFAAATEEAHH
ncbi:MAG: F0F1 ATP synthase subunit A [Bacteroidota bacterium]